LRTLGVCLRGRSTPSKTNGESHLGRSQFVNFPRSVSFGWMKEFDGRQETRRAS